MLQFDAKLLKLQTQNAKNQHGTQGVGVTQDIFRKVCHFHQVLNGYTRKAHLEHISITFEIASVSALTILYGLFFIIYIYIFTLA